MKATWADGLLFFAGTFTGLAIGILASSPGPAPCSVAASPGHQRGFTLISGDAGEVWMPGIQAYEEFVCTDGTLVHVTGYGAP